MLTAMSVGTMFLGNLLAIFQTNVKRFLAYSSIAHAGYALMGVVALSSDGAAAHPSFTWRLTPLPIWLPLR